MAVTFQGLYLHVNCYNFTHFFEMSLSMMVILTFVVSHLFFRLCMGACFHSWFCKLNGYPSRSQWNNYLPLYAFFRSASHIMDFCPF